MVSLPCNCSMSGCSASTMLSSVASSASTVSATLSGAALGLPAEFARRLQAEMPRRRRKEHEAHHVGARLQRDVERLARGQAANFDEQGHGSTHGLKAIATGRNGRGDCGRVLQRRALLVSPDRPRRIRSGDGAGQALLIVPREAAAAARRSASCARACRASASCWRAARRQWRCRNQVAMPPATTPRIATAMMTTNSGSVTAIDGSAELNGSNDTVTRCRLATAKTMKIRPSGITTSAVRNFRMTISRVTGDRCVHALQNTRATRQTMRRSKRFTRRPRDSARRGSAARAFPCRS